MMRHMRPVLPLLLAASASASALSAQAPAVSVDQRIELFSIIFRLAGNPEYNQCAVPAYDTAITRRFGPYRDHPAVTEARRLRVQRGIAFDAVINVALHVTDVQTLEERVALDAPGLALDARWRPSEMRAFLALARRFVQDTRFADFATVQQPIWDSAAARLRTVLERDVDVPWFDGFFGPRAGAAFYLVAGVCNGGANYGQRFRAPDGREDLYAVIGAWQADSAGFPSYDDRVVPTIVHEFGHSFVNPVMDAQQPAMAAAGPRILEAVGDLMRPQAYGQWGTVINETVVRAATARYTLAHRERRIAESAVLAEQARGFIWMDEVVARFDEYEADRARYPDLAAFAPRLAAYFDSLGERAADLRRAYDARRPRVVSVTPAVDAADVDTATTAVVVRFDRPMRRSHSAVRVNTALFPSVTAVEWDSSGTVWTLRVRLERGRSYGFTLNSATGGNFLSAEGVALAPYAVRFRTRAP
jgi:hypothetical protein